jgi:hypothetical protein
MRLMAPLVTVAVILGLAGLKGWYVRRKANHVTQ